MNTTTIFFKDSITQIKRSVEIAVSSLVSYGVVLLLIKLRFQAASNICCMVSVLKQTFPSLVPWGDFNFSFFSFLFIFWVSDAN